MRSLLVALCLGCGAQEPDRSTPEKTVAAFATGLGSLEQFREITFKLEGEGLKLSSFCRTPKLNAEKQKERAEMEGVKLRTTVRIVGRDIKLVGKAQDDKATVEVIEHYKEQNRDFLDQRLEYLTEKVGDNWLINEVYQYCYDCHESGKCAPCQGTGLSRGQPCPNCMGAKICAACSGKGKKLIDTVVPSPIVEPETVDPVYSTDLSTPSAAAKTYSDQAFRALVERNRKLWQQRKQARDLMEIYFTKDAVRTTDAVLSKCRQLSKVLYERAKPRIQAVTLQGDTASAVIVSETRKKVIFRKTGDNWMADQEIDPCGTCDGSGVCRSCSGSGKREGKKCYLCSGSSICYACKGTAWPSE